MMDVLTANRRLYLARSTVVARPPMVSANRCRSRHGRAVTLTTPQRLGAANGVSSPATHGTGSVELGEEVAAAVVLREGKTATEQEIRAFVATKLADFKVPKKILIMTEIPKGATGKLQRIGLAQKLGLVA